ncbi:MAG: PKD domain-containing protein, partial [Candidatus Hydrogenedentes bacterium]|nr:PKD domain-containing protein [Candidatus Hydrogenedentota bacterium]
TVVVPLPDASFTANGERFVIGDTVQFLDESRPPEGGSITSWLWTFGDGATSTEQNPAHAYNAAGRYDVSLSITTTGGNRQKVRTGAISVFQGTALDTYVRAADTHYSYNIVNTASYFGFTLTTLNMTSQQWRTSQEVDLPIWTHWMAIAEPPVLTTDTAILFISGGSTSSGSPNSETLGALLTLADALGAVVGIVQQVPNEPLLFAGETASRTEDEIIAYTFDKYMTTGDDTWPALFPMAKSVVRAMDTVQSVVTSTSAKTTASPVRYFVLSGASKRGWTTWLTSITDPRVVAAAPMVIDVLNMQTQMDHQFHAYGAYSDQVQDYVDLDIFGRFNTPEGQALLRLVDPFHYLERLDFPKLMINATGDEFFLPDSAQFYYPYLPGANYLRYIPNTGHGLLGYTQTLEETIPVLRAAVDSLWAPGFSWEVRSDGAIVVTPGDRPSDKPSSVKLWQATNTKARNFRLDEIGAAWTSTELHPDASGNYVGFPVAPAKWTAYMVELTIPSGDVKPYVFTTEVRVTPDELPF